METDTQTHKPKQTAQPASLQDGGSSLPTVYSFQSGLDGQGCLPYSNSAGGISEVSPVPLERNLLQIQGNAFWTKHSPICVHKIAEKVPLFAQNPWDQDHCISGRHAPCSFQQATPEGSGQHDHLPTSSPRLQSEMGVVIISSPSKLRIYRARNRLSPNDLTDTPIYLTKDQK